MADVRRLTFTISVVALLVCTIHLAATTATRYHGTRIIRALSSEKTESRRPLAFQAPKARNVEPRISEASEKGAIAGALFNDGQTLAAKWTEPSLRKAIDKFMSARAQWRAVGDRYHELAALHALAETLVNLSEYQAAFTAFAEALSLSRSPSDQAQALNGLSLVSVYQGEQKKALAYSQRAAALSRRVGDKRGEAESLINAGEVYYFFSDNQKALRTFEEALTLCPDPTWRARSRLFVDMGYAQFDLRNMDQALASYQKSLTQSKADGDKRREALALTAIGGVYSYLGNKQTALQYQTDAVALFRIIGDRNGEGVALNGLGYAYRNLAEFQRSLDCYLKAYKLFQLLGNREYESFTITRVGKAYEGLDDRVKAMEYYELAFHRAARYPQTQVNALNSIGSILESEGQFQRASVYYKKSLAIYRAIGDKMGEASVLNSIGKVSSFFGQRAQASKYYREALRISQAAHDRRGESSVLLNISKSQAESGDWEQARKTIENSLRIVESLRSEVGSTDLRASYFASVRQHYESYVSILMRLQKRESSTGLVEQAFAVSERAHARSLLELLAEAHADIQEGVDPALVEKEHLLEEQLNRAAIQHMRLLTDNKTEEAAELAKKIDELTSEYDDVKAQIVAKSPRYAALTQPQPLTLAEIQRRLFDDDTLLLEYMLGDEQSYLWAVTKTEISSYELPGRAQIERAAHQFQELLTAPQPIAGETFEQRQWRIKGADAQIAQVAASFSQVVLGPVADKLGYKRLLIVPDGALQYIPFQALTVPATMNATDSKQKKPDAESPEQLPLIANHEVVNEPSASILALVLADTSQRKPAPDSIAVFANPVFGKDDSRVKSSAPSQTKGPDLAPTSTIDQVLRDIGFEQRIQPLPASRDEAEAILAVAPSGTELKALDFDASRATVTKPEIANYRIVHFATHGFVDYRHPELSGLVLSLVDQTGQPQDGFLRLHDIYNLRLSADLVVLSACNTGLGKEVKGEGLIGLTRGFLYAGAGGVAASLWKVDDEATAELMKRFYEGMFNKGLTPAAALREAQLAMWQQKRWHAPYYWSAFVLQGQYDQKEVVPSKFPRLTTLITASVTVIALACLFVLIKRRRRLSSSGTITGRKRVFGRE